MGLRNTRLILSEVEGSGPSLRRVPILSRARPPRNEVPGRALLRGQRQGEDLARLTDAAQGVAAERLEAGGAALGRGGELRRDQDLAAQRLAQSLDARDLIDGGADDGEVDAVGGA